MKEGERLKGQSSLICRGEGRRGGGGCRLSSKISRSTAVQKNPRNTQLKSLKGSRHEGIQLYTPYGPAERGGGLFVEAKSSIKCCISALHLVETAGARLGCFWVRLASSRPPV
jgi:hypothetical protein